MVIVSFDVMLQLILNDGFLLFPVFILKKKKRTEKLIYSIFFVIVQKWDNDSDNPASWKNLMPSKRQTVSRRDVS